MSTKSFKCPICGNETHLSMGAIVRDDSIVPNPWVDSGKIGRVDNSSMIRFGNTLCVDGGGFELKSYFKAYACSKCGHISLFAEPFIEQMKAKKASLEEERKELQKQLACLENGIKETRKQRDAFKSEVAKITKELSSDEITVRRQRELQAQLESLQETLKGFKNLEAVEKQINDIEEKLDKNANELGEFA